MKMMMVVIIIDKPVSQKLVHIKLNMSILLLYTLDFLFYSIYLSPLFIISRISFHSFCYFLYFSLSKKEKLVKCLPSLCRIFKKIRKSPISFLFQCRVQTCYTIFKQDLSVKASFSTHYYLYFPFFVKQKNGMDKDTKKAVENTEYRLQNEQIYVHSLSKCVYFSKPKILFFSME